MSRKRPATTGIDSDEGKVVRSVATGESGVVRNESGRLVVELRDRNETWPYYAHEWRPVVLGSTRVAPMERARICYEVDAMLRTALGYAATGKPWGLVGDRDRVAWRKTQQVEVGPRQEARQAVMAAIMEVFRHEADPQDDR